MDGSGLVLENAEAFPTEAVLFPFLRLAGKQRQDPAAYLPASAAGVSGFTGRESPEQALPSCP